MVMIGIWYLLIAISFYLYSIDIINKKWDFSVILCCLFWPWVFPVAVLSGIGLYLWNKIIEWWEK